MISLLIPFLIELANPLQPRHDYYYGSTYYYPYSTRTTSSYRSRSTDNDAVVGLVFIVIFFFIIGLIICFVCRKCRNNEQVASPYYPPIQPNYAYPQSYNPGYYQQYSPTNLVYPNPPMQPGPAYPQPVDYSLNVPDNWQGPDYFTSRKLKENCGFCRSFSKYGEEPRVMLGCAERHTFHLFCLNQYRAGASRQGSTSYASNTCPMCNQLVNDKIRFYCMLCKEKGVQLNLSEFSDEHGVVDITRLIGKYGEYCTNCKRM